MLRIGLCVSLAGICLAADPVASAGHFRTNADVVLVHATVLDRHDHPVRGLLREQFRIYEDKTEQRITYFSEEEAPVSIAVIFDVSGSMHWKLDRMRVALATVLKSANVGDEFSLITFADEPKVAAAWSEDSSDLQNRLLEASAHGQTSLLDAIETGLGYLKKARNRRKAMIVFSDGGDNHSRSSEREVLRSMAEADVQIYAIQSMEATAFRPMLPEELAGPDLLGRLCDHAGGRYFQVDGKRELSAAAEQISRELRSQYLIGYVPPSGANDGRFHSVRLQVKRNGGDPRVSVFWRRGYRSPAE